MANNVQEIKAPIGLLRFIHEALYSMPSRLLWGRNKKLTNDKIL